MRSRFLVISLILMATIVGVSMVWFTGQTAGTTGEAAPLSQSDIVARAIAHAQQVGLQGAPTAVVAKQMTFAEFSARLDPFSSLAGQNTPVWLVVMEGKVIYTNPPGPDGKLSQTTYDNIWVQLDTKGVVNSWGSQTAGNKLDLNVPATPLTKWPAPENPNK